MNKSSVPDKYGEFLATEDRAAYAGGSEIYGGTHKQGHEPFLNGFVSREEYEALERRLTEAENAIPALRLNRTAPSSVLLSGNSREDFLRRVLTKQSEEIERLKRERGGQKHNERIYGGATAEGEWSDALVDKLRNKVEELQDASPYADTSTNQLDEALKTIMQLEEIIAEKNRDLHDAYEKLARKGK